MEITFNTSNSKFKDMEVRWYLSNQNIWIGTQRNYSEIEDLIPKSYGSFQWLWSEADTLLFDRDSLILNAAILKIKEPINLNASKFSMNSIENMESSICIKNKDNFSISLSDSVDYFYKDDILFSQTSGLVEDLRTIKCMITEDFGFIIQNNLLMGWVLYNASIHLTPEGNSIISKNDPIPSLNKVLGEYLDIVKQLESNSTEIEEDLFKSKLTELFESVSAYSQPQFIAIKTSIENILEYL